ncbi:sugar ABC transporter substrate-binding protein [Paenibacillus alkaliterrae]|uniref:ABC transporter substrate-binding protein n=1 Tax=Paenibacillus alkaliterrae TaxID=320909 RepID=UPI001F3525D4|nr:sugar ABC transporter substrate-binding protein [Paenibacillus alkaliterrae]MCF2941322.1 sugar ABC transporter substrate-binding protein [Paenibacillus alkaliterrae]
MLKMLKLGLITTLILTMTIGCGQNKNESATGGQTKTESTAPAKQQDNVKLVYYGWNPSEEQMTKSMIEKFEEENPNITIEYFAYEPSSYWPKISALAASGNLPDVFEMSSGYVDEWASKGLLHNIQSMVDRDIDKNNYFTSVFNAVKYPDKETGDMYAFPYAWVTTVLYYNKDLFDAAKLEYPKKEWTWDDFLNAAKKLTIDKNGDGKTDQWGLYLFGRYAHIEPWVYQNEGRLLNEDKTKFELNANGKEALQFLTDLTVKHKVSPSPKDITGIKQDEMFGQGKVAMWVDGSFAIDGTRKTVGDNFNWDITTIPRGPNWKEDMTYGWPDNISISKNSKHAEEAWKFIKFMSGKDRPIETYSGGKVPIYKPTANQQAWLETDKQPASKKIILEQGANIGRNSYTKSWSEWRGYAAAKGSGLNGELDQVFDGQKTLDQAIESVTPFANEVLSRK